MRKTLIIGTSKSNPLKDGYYINNSRFWEIINDELNLNEEVNSYNYGILENEYGIVFTELVPSEVRIIKRDNNITVHDLIEGKSYLDDLIHGNPIWQLVFVGKTAFKWFALTNLKDMDNNICIQNTEYGINHTYYFKDIPCHILTNTHTHFDENIWRAFWQYVNNNFIEVFN